VSLFLLTLVALFLSYRFWQSFAEHSSQSRRDTRKIEMRRADCARSPQSPGSHESLGDALREAGRYRDALTVYENAKALMTEAGAGGAGILGGSGIDTKIRLVRLDIKDDADRPASYVEQVTRRESVCRMCSLVNAPTAKHCTSCGSDLPTDSFGETWIRDDIRKPLLREAREAFVVMAVVLFALYMSNSLPLEVRGTLLFSTVIVLTWKGLRAIGGK